MSSHFANHVRESVIGADASKAIVTSYDMEAIKQLSCAVIHEAVENAAGRGCKLTVAIQREAREFLLNTDGAIIPWATLGGISVDAIKDFALKRGYDQWSETIARIMETTSPTASSALPDAGAGSGPSSCTASEGLPTFLLSSSCLPSPSLATLLDGMAFSLGGDDDDYQDGE